MESMEYSQLFVGGRWSNPLSSGRIVVRSPHNQELVGGTPEASRADVDAAVEAARRAFDRGPWPRLDPAERAARIVLFDTLHASRTKEIAQLITQENGSPIWFTEALQTSLTEQTGAYLRAAKAHPWELPLPSGGTVVRSEPVGVVVAVIPWNAPHQSALAKMIPALLAGCTVILKPSPETALDAMLLAEVFDAAGLPEGVVSVLPAGRDVSEYLVSRPGVDKIAFTGSTAAGRRIGAIAGQQLKRASLELGGKSATLVLEDADVSALAEGLKYASFANNGESCIAHTRVLVQRSIYDEAVEAIGSMVAGLVVGNPAETSTFIGPMVRADQQERVRSYIRTGISDGARLVVGGAHAPEDAGLASGFYVTPTVLADVDNSSNLAQEEIFGPVLSIIPFDTEAEGVDMANDSPYGLSGGVWTADRERATAIARSIRTGTFSINGAPQSYEAPFGGFKASGVGREFGAAGLNAYLEAKSIAGWVDPSSGIR